ncbi:aspartate aminotransferase family protein [Amycolatopsis sp. NPDC059657]|uniref:aspartate aminotransferase family protein n=1 Tax=Amycolatopsis sp. NPDC059657 TaxID=3346899 RepID=UPI00366EBBED
MAFLARYAAAFGRNGAFMLRMAGLTGGELSADGAWITDTGGRRWLDFGSFGVHLLGHRHPVVTAHAHEQLNLMGLSGKVLGNAAATSCGEALLAATPPNLDRVTLANTGAEAVDMAVKMVLLATGRDELLAFNRSYHGKTVAALSLSDTVQTAASIGLRNQVHFAEPEDLAAVRRILAARRVAGVFVEPVQGEGGVRPISPGFLAGLRGLCTATGTPLVFDEIQTGLGRTGRRWRSADDVPPDLLLAGKTLGGGLVPLSAVVFDGSVIGSVATDPVVLASSFAGGAFACRIGSAVLGLVQDEKLLARVRELGARATSELRATFADDPRIREVRGEGLMIGIDTAAPSVAGHLVVEAAKRGLLVSFCLSYPQVVRVYPPAVISDDDLTCGLDALAGAVSAIPEPAV